jgi:hypothetical protein
MDLSRHLDRILARVLLLRRALSYRLGAFWTDLRDAVPRAPAAIRAFIANDMRWSYYAVIGFLIIGVIANIFLPNGWTVWPFLFGAGVLSMVHEAAERNGEGIPPLHVYAFIIGAIVFWGGFIFILTLINPLVLLIGFIAIVYQCGRGFVHERERNRIIAQRQKEGRCIHCGESVPKYHVICLACGNEADPSSTRLRRVASIVGMRKSPAHMRAVLTREAPSASASRREKALIAQSARNRPRTGKKH